MKTMTMTEPRDAIRRAALAFEAVRRSEDADAGAGPAWKALGLAIASAGYAAAILDGTFYLASALVAELADRDDEYGDLAFRAALVLDLDQVDDEAR